MTRRTVAAGIAAIGLAVSLTSPSGATVGPAADLHQTELTANQSGNLYFFGNSVAISGNIIAVGAPGQGGTSGANQGAVYVYEKGAAGWQDATQIAVLTASDGATEDQFGEQVAMTSNTIVVDSFLKTVLGHVDQGAAYVFVKPATGWQTATQNAELTASDGAAHDRMGAVAISGNTVVAGTPDHKIGGNVDQGAAYVFTEPSTGWHDETQQAELTVAGEANDQFGSGVAVNGDDVYVGSPGAVVSGSSHPGAVLVFTKPGSTWSDESSPDVLVASDGADGDLLGDSVAVSGGTVIAAAIGRHVGSNVSQGAVYVFTEPTSGWPLLQDQAAELTQKDGENQDQLGDSLAISGDTIVAGAHQHDLGAAAAEGVAYLFTEPPSGWANASARANLLASDGQAGDGFGYAVAASPSALVVGAISHATATEHGVAYVFALPRPAVSRLEQSRTSWLAGNRAAVVNPRHRDKGGTVFSFRLSDAGRVTVAFAKHTAGHVSSKGAVKFAARKGKTRLYFDGRIRHHKTFAPGPYTITVTANNSGGTSVAARLRFTVKPARKH